MSDLSFGGTIGMLKDALSGAADEHSAIANNLVNANTPNFKRMDVTFKDSLAAAYTEQPILGDELQMVTDNPHQISTNPFTTEPVPFEVTHTVDHDMTMRVDGSNVDLDQEMAKLSLNSSYSQTMGQLLGVQYTRIRQAIQEHA